MMITLEAGASQENRSDNPICWVQGRAGTLTLRGGWNPSANVRGNRWGMGLTGGGEVGILYLSSQKVRGRNLVHPYVGMITRLRLALYLWPVGRSSV